jgi:hypothetical protein
MTHASFTVGKLKVTTFEPPPKGFDATKASKKELIVHGFPLPPDRERFPEAFAQWQHAVAKPWRWVTPKFGAPVKSRGPSSRRAVEVQNTTHTENWAGSVATAGAGDSFSWITAVVSVPDPNPYYPIPPSGAEADVPFFLSNWIGIDGGVGGGSQDVLQVGVSQEVVYKKNPATTQTRNCYAFFEWYEGPGDLTGSTPVEGFPVSPGDAVNILLCATSSTDATIFLTNESTLDATSFTLSSPLPKLALRGDSCQWVVERPTIIVGGGAPEFSYLPNFPTIYFESTRAGTTKGIPFSAATGVLQTMVDASGKPLATPIIDGSIMKVVRD